MPFNRPLRSSQSRSKMSSGLDAIIQAEAGIQIALILPSAVVICWLIGAWADKHFHQSWIAIFGVVFGAISGLVYIIQYVLRAEKAAEKDMPHEADAQNGTGSGPTDESQ